MASDSENEVLRATLAGLIAAGYKVVDKRDRGLLVKVGDDEVMVGIRVVSPVSYDRGRGLDIALPKKEN